MHERPQRALFDALRQLGCRVDSPNDKFPALISTAGAQHGASVRVSIAESSQFASGLMLAGYRVVVDGGDPEEQAYLRMTSEMIRDFPVQGGRYVVEPDASSASYFWGAAWLLPDCRIRIANWMERSLQIDARFPQLLRQFPSRLSRQTDLGDSIMTAIVLAPFATEPKQFVDLGRLRVQECERVYALKTELLKCGANVVESGDALTVYPGALHGATIHTYGDHRIAMAFGVLSAVSGGAITVDDPECAIVSFPGFWELLSHVTR